jgi:hypothetical protein
MDPRSYFEFPKIARTGCMSLNVWLEDTALLKGRKLTVAIQECADFGIEDTDE